MFFIGAPLGPSFVKGTRTSNSICNFNFYNSILSTPFGRKVAQQDSILLFRAWLASILMTPFAIILTYRATK